MESKAQSDTVDARSIASSGLGSDDDDKILQQIGYVPSFRREFSNLATVRVQLASVSSVFRLSYHYR